MGTRQQGFNTVFQLYGDKLLSTYDEYATVRSVLRFKCMDCDNIFQTSSWLYQKSNDGKRCLFCKQKNAVTNPSTRDKFIQQCIKKHGGYYSYEFIPDKFKKKDKITIVCPKHGKIQTTGDTHLGKGCGCAKCKIDKITSITRSNKTDFIKKANDIHKFKYNYNNVVYTNAITNVEIVCPKHGTFFQTPDVHLRGSGCSGCINSIRCKDIEQSLIKHNIIYVREKKFDGCVGTGNRLLRFDFFIPQYSLAIEYDGPHHFFPFKYGEMTDEVAIEKFQIQQQNDEIKNQYCSTNNIELFRIPYTDPNPDATIIKLITSKTPQRYVYSWDDLDKDIQKICNYIKTFNYSKFAIYGILRGGSVFAVPISYHFDKISELGLIQYQRYDGNDGNDQKVIFNVKHKTENIPIFIIDDLISSGITMKKAISAIKRQNRKSKIHPIVIFGEENPNNIFFIREHPKMWVEFPYEK